MKTKIQNLFATLTLLALAALDSQFSEAFAQTTAFTFQGQLNSGAGNANGLYDLRFAVYDANVAGNQIAGPVTNSTVAVSNGLFTVYLDFGAGLFTGTNYFVEMGVRTNGGGNFLTLAPRQQLTPAPAAFSLSAKSPQFNSFCPPGSIMAYGGTTVPPGWLPCNGTNVSRTTYAALFAVIGTSAGAGDLSTTFNLPDLRGVFLRGMDIGNVTGRDPDGSSRRAFYPGGNTGANIATYQDDAFQGHYHEMEFAFNNPGGGNARPYYSGTGTILHSSSDPTLAKAYQAASDGSHGTPKISSETRPLNFTVNYIIKY
jgi:microcystin-dependent protein